MHRVLVHTPIRGRAEAGETIELDAATFAELEPLGAVELVEQALVEPTPSWLLGLTIPETVGANLLAGIFGEGATARYPEDAPWVPPAPEHNQYQGGAGPAEPEGGAMAPATGDAGKAAGAEDQPAAADPGATAAANTAAAAEVSRGGADTQGAAAPTVKASEQPAVPPAAGRRPRAPRKPAQPKEA